MLFNSISFAVFFLMVFTLYWYVFDYALKRYKYQVIVQNIFLILASYVFYAWWNWRFLGLLVCMSLISWGAGEYIIKSKIKGSRLCKCVVSLTISIDVLILGFFKYFNFFIDSFCQLLSINNHQSSISIILPLGISFYTFQAISYVVDSYRGKQPLNFYGTPYKIVSSKANNLIDCLLYIGFFPKLLAGPIERPTHLIPQIQQKRVFDYDMAIDGSRQILWGLFKKMVVADNCAIYVDTVFGDYINQCGSTLLLAAILYTIQIYGDFSGYSDMAIGSAKLLGFKFRDNFLFPYFSRNMNEFWRRWHISLNTWFVDYVYIPLGGSRNGKVRTIANTMIIFVLSGLWHGANWTFVIWGGYHGLLLVLLIIFNRNIKYMHVVAYDRMLPSIKELGQMMLVFSLATIGWMMFRADDISMFVEYVRYMVNTPWGHPWLKNRSLFMPLIVNIIVMLGCEWSDKNSSCTFSFLKNKHMLFRVLWCYLLLADILFFMQQNVQYVYFKF